MNLMVELVPGQKKSLTLRNPVLLAAGTAGFGVEYSRIAETQHIGALVCNSVTLRPYSGAPQPLMLETPAGLLYAPDQPNPGIQRVLKTYAPVWSGWETPVIVSLAGTEIAEFAELAARLEGVPGIAGLELNLNCPDFAWNDLSFDADPLRTERLVTAVRQQTTLPLIAKLTLSLGDVYAVAMAAIAAGVEAIALAPSLPGLSIDIRTRRPVLFGGLAGPAIKPLALRLFYDLAAELHRAAPHIPLIGSGGISSTQDALEFVLAGASAIQIGTATFANPRTAVEIVEGLTAFLLQEGLNDISELIGAAQQDW